MPNYRRSHVEGGCYFFTVVLANRNNSLLTYYINNLRQAFRDVMKVHPFKIDAAVVLPNHLHCILTLPVGDDNYSMRWRQIKSAFSRQLPSIEYRTNSRIKKGERGIWQRRFWEHVLCDERDYRQHVDYIHYNPVKHGYVKRVVDWEYSSFHRAVAQGISLSNWGGSDKEMDLEYGE
ncbi:transposase [Candidatus Thiomargarita nelsonii]|uniref:Transposase n=1 Tax=Candidatus Thiomargarita nelsonii TaxID=1003181 RepID=A0A0A6PCH5_9GAMM|nr:transposase [Candidatus Thiomargarita nelsonii]